MEPRYVELTREDGTEGTLMERATEIFLEQLLALSQGKLSSFTMTVTNPDAQEPQQPAIEPQVVHVVVKEQPTIEQAVRIKVIEHEPQVVTHLRIKPTEPTNKPTLSGWIPPRKEIRKDS